MTDEELVLQARQGDTDAFDQLASRHQAAVYRAALAALRVPEDAEEAAQDAFVRAWSSLKRFRAESSFKWRACGSSRSLCSEGDNMRKLCTGFAMVMGLAGVAAAQGQLAPPADAQRAASPAPSPANIRVELTIIDEGGPQTVRKTVSLTVADRRDGYVRAAGRPPGSDPNVPSGFVLIGPDGKRSEMTPTTPGVSVPLNVDVRPWLEADGRIRTRVVLEYQPYSADAKTAAASIRGMFEPVLDSGRKMVVWQAADPVSDRRVSVELTATILK